MYSVPNQVLFHQLSQITCGVLTCTASNPGVRSGTPRTAQKVRLHRPYSTKDISSGYVTPASISTDIVTSNLNGDGEASVLSNGPQEIFVDSLCTAPGVPVAEDKKTTTATEDKFNLSNVVCDSTSDASNKSSEAVFSISRILGDLDISKSFPHTARLVSAQQEFAQAIQYIIRNNELYSFANKLEEMNKSSIIQNLQALIFEAKEGLTLTSNYRQSYVSAGSFEIDKKSFYNGPNLISHPFHYVPVRTFKTKRDSQAADERNPTLFTRIKNKLFPPRIESLNSTSTPLSSDKLKTMLADLPVDDANKMKIAFAEGYIAANPTNQSQNNRTYRWLRTLQQVLVIAVFTALLASLMGSFGGGMFRVNVGNGNEVMPEDINVSFSDVKGVDEAKAELQEIVEFLRNPDKFVTLGGKLPKGVLLVGPPGTGKTLLARAVAGEAGVPFFHAAGPEFDEILVGQGARRVRDLFKAAKVKAPCVVFIDEIDSVGAKRTNSVLHPYANQTINQLLSEMDGFRQNEGVIVLGATNRREDLDKALLRPGRFDVEVPVPAPEYIGRKEILDYYLTRVKRGEDVDVDILARGTIGFTGADLENMVNQAALKAAIDGADRVLKKHLDFARDKVIMGPERKSRIPDEETNKLTAYHEGGHALVAHYTKDANTLHKVTIIPRGHSLGHTAYIPEKEQYHVTRSQLMALMDTMMGGRAAEELIFGIEKITSGASSDLKQATAIASNMVKEWGMSEKVGLRTVEDGNRSLVAVNELGPATSELIDSEIKRLLQESYERAKSILRNHSKELKALAEALIKYETLDADDVKAILSGQTPVTPLKSKVVAPTPVVTQPTRPISPKPPTPASPNKVPC